MEAMESGPGVPDAEAPVDHGLCVVSLLFQRVDLPAEGLLVRVPLPESSAGEDAEFDLRLPSVKLRTGFSQLPASAPARTGS